MITGKNAQGKTNLIEAVWLMTGCKSFRGSKERECIAVGQPEARISMTFQNSFRTQEISVKLSRNHKDREIMLNGISYKGNRKLFEEFRCIAFLPSDISLTEGSPDKRRSFIDMCCSQIKPSFMDLIKRFSVIMSHRSAVLRNYNADSSQLFVWNEQISSIGSQIALARYQFISELAPIAKKLYAEITSGVENLEILYKSSVFPFGFVYPDKVNSQMLDIYRKKLEESSADDIRLGYTQYGIHRDDVEIKINGLPVRLYGSQGQKKSCALIMKLAQAEMLKNKLREAPVILLDDVMSELDFSRQKLVSEITDGMQVFITTCSTEAVMLDNIYNIFHIQNGSIISTSNS